jgi:antitoxin ParD1/3/4
MGSLNVNMPDDLREYVDERTKKGGFGTPTEYVRHLIRKDKEEAAERELEQLVLEGIRSGRSRTDLKTFLKRMHRRVDEIEAQRKQAKGKGGKTARTNSRG